MNGPGSTETSRIRLFKSSNTHTQTQHTLGHKKPRTERRTRTFPSPSRTSAPSHCACARVCALCPARFAVRFSGTAKRSVMNLTIIFIAPNANRPLPVTSVIHRPHKPFQPSHTRTEKKTPKNSLR